MKLNWLRLAYILGGIGALVLGVVPALAGQSAAIIAAGMYLLGVATRGGWEDM